MAPGDDDPLQRALRELAQATPEEFVLVRSRLERELKDAGHTDAAAGLRRRRRPHLAAWACNQLAHREADVLGELMASTGEVATAQQAALRGENGSRLRDAGRERQEALARAVDTAVDMLRGVTPDPAGYRDAIAATLDAASVDADASRELNAGLLTKPLRAPAGLGLGAPAPTDIPAPKISARERDRARREVERARSEASELSAAAEEAQAEQASAEMQVHSAGVHIDEIQAALTRAKESARAADATLEAARQRANDARRAAAEGAERLRHAEARLEALDGERVLE